MRPSSPPTVADLYLAFRQAKTALYFERRGVGLLELATFEQDLPKNLKALQHKLAKGGWFDQLELGPAWLVPKRLRAAQGEDDDVVRIGVPRHDTTGRPVDIQIRLSPHPAFAVVEVLYLWQFGGLLDGMLSKEVLGYRLDLRDQRVVPHRRWLFEYWPSRYQQYRTAPLEAARSALSRGEQVLIISGDLASFYDTVAPAFLLSDAIIAELHATGIDFDVGAYQKATRSLLGAYQRFQMRSMARGDSGSTPVFQSAR